MFVQPKEVEGIYLSNAPRLKAYAIRWGCPAHNSEDAVHDAFAGFLGLVEERRVRWVQIPGIVFRMVKFAVYRILRRVNVGIADEGGIPDGENGQDERVWEVLKVAGGDPELSVLQREIVILKFFWEFTRVEIVRRLGVTPYRLGREWDVIVLYLEKKFGEEGLDLSDFSGSGWERHAK